MIFRLLRSKTMDWERDKIAVGTRFKLNAFGAVRCPSLADKVGTVVGVSRRTTGITVLFDGSRRSTCLHRDYISSISEQR
jgi:hypothetical protein